MLNYFKKLVKKITPDFLINNPIRFYLKRMVYFKSIDQGSLEPKYKDYYNTLENDGILIIPDYKSKIFCDKILKELSQEKKSLQNGNISKPNYITSKSDGMYRLLKCDEEFSLTKEFFDDQFIISIAKSFCGKDSFIYQKMFELRKGKNTESAGKLHFDDWKHRFKAFLYLNDVNMNNSPFVYVKKSHNPKGWYFERFIKEYNYYLYGKKGEYGEYSENKKQYILKKYSFKETFATGKKGTLVLFDGRGLHRGETLKNSERNILASYFTV